MASTATAANNNPKTKAGQPAQDLSYVEEIRDMVKDLMPRFPFLSKAPDALYWVMATFGAESHWRLLHGKSPNVSSRHLTASPPKHESTKGLGPFKSTGTLTGNGYQYSNLIQNLWNDPAVTTQIRENIKDGWYAHGISACMGSYHVRGCPNNLGEWRSRPENLPIIEELGLEVDPGVSIVQTLFGADNATCRKRSVASGMIIFNIKYRQGLQRYGNDTARAMQYALGAYLGAEGARDANNVSPDDRRRDVSSNSGRISILQAVQVARSGNNTVLSAGLIDLANQEAKSKGSTKVNNNPSAYVATTNSGSNGKSGKTSGCEV